MPKIIKDIKNQPKTLKEIWKVFIGNDKYIETKIENIEKNIKIIETDIKKINKGKKWSKIKSWILVIAAVISVGIAFCVAIGLFETVEESNVVADETISSSLYQLIFRNDGGAENGLQIEIWFGNYKIDSFYLSHGISQLAYNDTTHSDTRFAALYSSINENQEFYVYVYLINDSTEKIKPIYVRAWTNKGEVTINHDSG